MKETNFDRTNFTNCMDAYTAALNEHKELVETFIFQGGDWYIDEYCCTNMRELGFGEIHYSKDGVPDIIFKGYQLNEWFGDVDWNKPKNRESLESFVQHNLKSHDEDFVAEFLKYVEKVSA